MPDENDDILNISLDDDHEHASAGDDVLDIDLEMDAPPEPGSSPLAPAPKPMPLSPSPADKDDVADLPMVSAGVCARCGYALRPLEDQCPRCARSGPAAPAPSDPGEHAPDEGHVEHDFPPARSNRGCLIWGIIGSCLLLATAVGIPLAIWMQPGQQAKRQYQLGLQAQIRANFEEARHYYLKALELDPEMGLAAFSMGTTYLGIGNPALMDAIQALTERASNGQTRTLDTADEWFRKTIEIGQRLPASKQLMDQRIRTPAHLRAFAHASLALTALIRASAAMQADALEDATAWFQVVQREAQAALVDDPTNASAEQILRTVEPLIPPASGVN
jgi:tetratricopeptide (TPR) repeat protein